MAKTLHWYYRKKVDHLTKNYYEKTFRVHGFQERSNGEPFLNATSYKGSTTTEKFARYICNTMNRIQIGETPEPLREEE